MSVRCGELSGSSGSADVGYAVVTGSDGTVTAAGQFDGRFGDSVDFGGGPMTSPYIDAFTVQYAP